MRWLLKVTQQQARNTVKVPNSKSMQQDFSYLLSIWLFLAQYRHYSICMNSYWMNTWTPSVLHIKNYPLFFPITWGTTTDLCLKLLLKNITHRNKLENLQSFSHTFNSNKLQFIQRGHPQKTNIQSIKCCHWNLFSNVECSGKDSPTPNMPCWFKSKIKACVTSKSSV